MKRDDALAWGIVLCILLALLGVVVGAMYLRGMYWRWVLEPVL